MARFYARFAAKCRVESFILETYRGILFERFISQSVSLHRRLNSFLRCVRCCHQIRSEFQPDSDLRGGVFGGAGKKAEGTIESFWRFLVCIKAKRKAYHRISTLRLLL